MSVELKQLQISRFYLHLQQAKLAAVQDKL